MSTASPPAYCRIMPSVLGLSFCWTLPLNLLYFMGHQRRTFVRIVSHNVKKCYFVISHGIQNVSHCIPWDTKCSPLYSYPMGYTMFLIVPISWDTMGNILCCMYQADQKSLKMSKILIILTNHAFSYSKDTV